MQDIDVILRDAQRRAALLFDKRPKAQVVAQPYPKFQEANNAARSIAPSPDGCRPGIYLYPRRLDRMTKFGLKSVTYHEMKRFPGTSSEGCKSKTRIRRGFASSAYSGAYPLPAKGGPFTPNVWQRNPAGTTMIRKDCPAS